MPLLSYEIQKAKQRSQMKAYALICLILLVGVGYYTYTSFVKYNSLQDSLSKNETYIQDLRKNLTDEQSTYEGNKEAFKATNEKINESLSAVFPPQDYYTKLTRELDDVEKDLNTNSNPFEISNIDFQKPIATDVYSILPFRMNIRSSNGNFIRFLHMIETSGSLDTKFRLMDIPSIRLSFEESEEQVGEQIIEFSVQLNTYFQLTDV